MLFLRIIRGGAGLPRPVRSRAPCPRVRLAVTSYSCSRRRRNERAWSGRVWRGPGSATFELAWCWHRAPQGFRFTASHKPSAGTRTVGNTAMKAPEASFAFFWMRSAVYPLQHRQRYITSVIRKNLFVLGGFFFVCLFCFVLFGVFLLFRIYMPV